MSDKIRVNYPALLEMAKHCDMVANRLNETASLAQKVAQQMNNGALVGEPGEIFASALQGPFLNRTKKLSAKFTEVSNDIKKAVEDMQTADRAAGGNF
jgi:uncharacterized protein YukE